MTIHIELPADELEALKQLTNGKDDADAVVLAAREFLRFRRLRELKGICGKVELDSQWQKLEELELGEIGSPITE